MLWKYRIPQLSTTPEELLGDITAVAKRYPVDIAKLRIGTTNYVLDGAVFDLYQVILSNSGKDTTLYLGGITSGTMGYNSGHYLINLPKCEEYLLYETKAPQGYLLPAKEEDRWTSFKITATLDTDTTRVTVYNTPAANPQSYLKVTLHPFTFECITLDPVAGEYYVKENECFTFRFIWEECCEPSYPFIPIVTANGDTIQMQADSSYTICGIRKPVDIIISAGEYHPPVANEKIDGNNKIWAYGGNLYVSLERRSKVRIYNTLGQLIQYMDASDGETIVTLKKGFYVVVLEDGTRKNVVIK